MRFGREGRRDDNEHKRDESGDESGHPPKSTVAGPSERLGEQ